MAIASCHVSVVSRGKGRSAVAAAAYRAGEKIYDEQTGSTYDYTRKTGIAYTDILTPSNAPEWTHDRQKLWNEVEHIEKASNARTAREVTIALPHELTRQQTIDLAKAYARTFVNEGMIADLAVHDKGDGNPHAHILLTTRPFNEDGTWGEKSKKEYLLDKKGNRILLPSGQYKSRKVDLVDWNKTEKVEEWRYRYQDMTNFHLNKAGSSERIDVRSYEEQGKEQIPTVHLGHYAHQLEQQGIPSARGNINRRIDEANQNLKAIDNQLALLKEAERLEIARQQERAARLQAEREAEAKRQQELADREAERAKRREDIKKHQKAYTRPQQEQRPARRGQQLWEERQREQRLVKHEDISFEEPARPPPPPQRSQQPKEPEQPGTPTHHIPDTERNKREHVSYEDLRKKAEGGYQRPRQRRREDHDYER